MSLHFLNNDADEDEGLADAGIETFRDAPFASVARECGQNSRDAVEAMPVSLSFDLVKIDPRDFPDISAFRRALGSCARRAGDRSDVKEVQFFQQAAELADASHISALRISDESTTGLRGPCTPGNPFHSLVKASGVSNKNDITSGGSFGIGKKAAFAVSDLHTVFYSTIYVDDNGLQQYLAQGKCTLVSHTQDDGSKKRATGYWGAENYQPVSNPEHAPSWLNRTSVGTTTVAAGFLAEPDWKFKIAESLVRNFFAAIHRDELWFFVDDNAIEIDSSSLAKVMLMPEIEAAAEDHGTRDELHFARVLFECLRSDSTVRIDTNIAGVGDFRIHLLVRDGLPKRVAFIRNGMMITDNLGAFGDKLTHFPMYKDFVAIVEPTNDDSKSLLKRLENPKHDQFSAERLITATEQKQVKKAMQNFRVWIRECIRSRAYVAPANETLLDEMNEFFGDVGDAERIPDPDRGDFDPSSITYKPLKRTKAKQSGRGDKPGGEGGSGARNAGTGGDRPGDGTKRGTNKGGDGDGQEFEYYALRNTQDPARPTRVRNVHFTPVNSGHATLKVSAKGMNEDVQIEGTIVRLPDGTPAEALKLKSAERVHVVVEFPVDYLGPIGVRLFNTKSESESEAE
jgi:hypothetical protein